jgi:L-threonylcarbamoyladenylate synthase
MSIVIDCSDPEERLRGLRLATQSLRTGKLAVIPTDTVYGLAADAFASRAVHELLAVKGRGPDMPVPVLVSSTVMFEAITAELTAGARALAAAFWPGALTLVTMHSPALAWDLGDSRGTVAVRMPDHELALELITGTGPLAVSSANRTGMPPATTAAAAAEMLGDEVEVYLDGGPTADSVPSTIVDVTGDGPRVLRLGAIGIDRLRAAAGDIES